LYGLALGLACFTAVAASFCILPPQIVGI
jgi:hypothetical protein